MLQVRRHVPAQIAQQPMGYVPYAPQPQIYVQVPALGQTQQAGLFTSASALPMIVGGVLGVVFSPLIKSLFGLGQTAAVRGVEKARRKIEPGAAPDEPRLPKPEGYGRKSPYEDFSRRAGRAQHGIDL